MEYTKLLGSVALAALLAISFTGCSDDGDDNDNDDTTVIASDAIPFGDGEFAAFERVAVFPTVKIADTNDTNYTATYAKVTELAGILGAYVANTDEPTDDNATFKSTNWILGGLESITAVNDFNTTTALEHTLFIPTPDFIVDGNSSSGGKKVRVVELCNSGYAAQALGVKIVGGTDTGAYVADGSYHATALPCEVTIYHDANGIYVDMLNPETIFTLFFTEVFSSAEMENTYFKDAMLALPTQVKTEIYSMIYSAFDDNNESYEKTDTKMGTVYTTMSSVLATTDTANDGKEPYRHYSYTDTNTSKEFTSTDAQNIAATIITVMTSEAEGTVGVQEDALLAALPSTITGDYVPGWRSGRLEPLKVPGGSWIVEACSGTYAKEALATGAYHTPALPCEIAVTVNPDNNNTIDVSFLNPEFMFGALFADAMADMNATTLAEYNTIIDNINGDLKKIVDYAMENNVTGFGTGTKITPINY